LFLQCRSYSRISKLQLPLTSVVEEFKVGKARLRHKDIVGVVRRGR